MLIPRGVEELSLAPFAPCATRILIARFHFREEPAQLGEVRRAPLLPNSSVSFGGFQRAQSSPATSTIMKTKRVHWNLKAVPSVSSVSWPERSPFSTREM